MNRAHFTRLIGSAGLLLIASCNDAVGPVPDGGTPAADAPSSSSCSEIDVTTLAAAEVLATTGWITARRTSFDGGTIMVVGARTTAGTAPGDTVVLEPENYATCDHCVVVYTGCDGRTCTGTYLAVAGMLHYREIGTYDIDVELDGVRLAEGTLDQSTGESTLFAGGDEICIPDLAISASVFD